MTAIVSARPDNLRSFVDDTRAASTTAQGDIARLRASWDAFAAADNEFGPADTGLMADGPAGVLGQHLDRWHRQEDFVDLVRRSFVAADQNAAHQLLNGPVVTMGDWRLDWHLRDQARRRGIDLTEMFAVAGPIVVPEPLQATPIPHDSGFVEDPVCTATGYFVDTALDLAMPERLQMLAWPRVYSSGPGRGGGGHGRGWGSWASVACGRRADGSLAYTGPDGQRLRLRPDRDGRGRVRCWRRTVWLRAVATPAGPADGDADVPDGGVDSEAGVEVRWDRESPHPDETWVFRADGTLAEVRSPAQGTTTAAYDHGRLVRLTHEGGRHLDVHWEEDRIARVVSSCDRTVGYRYDEQGDLVEVVSARQPRRYDLDADGRIVVVWDADGVRLCLTTYDRRGRVRRQESPFGRTTTFSYGDDRDGRADLDDRVTVVADTDGGPPSRWEHDRQGRVVGLVDAEGHRMTRTFDAEGRCLSVTGFDGGTVTYGYDDAGRLTSRRDDRGEERFHHDDRGRVVRHDRPGGSWTAYEYAGAGARPRRAHGPEGWEQIVDHRGGVVRRITDADGVTLEIESDDAGCPTAVTDGLGRTTTFAVHPSGEVAAVTQPDGATWVVDRDDAGRPTAVTGADGQRTEIRWTPGGRLHEVVGPGGARTRYHHGAHGEVDAVTDPRGRMVELAYDRLERLVGLAFGPGGRWALDHSPLGLVETVHDPGGHAWRFDHDAEGRTTALTDPLGHRHVYDHDAAGDLVREVDAAGGITHHLRDDAGRVVAVVDPEGGTTRVTHDRLGRVVRVESPDGGVVERRYTPAGRLAEEVTGEGRGRRLRYDAAGRLVEEVDALGGTTTYQRDAGGRIVAVTGPGGRTGRLTHDAAGRVVATEVDGSIWRTAYDPDGRVTALVDPLGATARFAYDAAGNLVAATDPLGHTTTYAWDDQGRCSAVTDPLGHTTRYRWDGRGLCLAAVDALDQETGYRYDAAGRPVGVELPDGRRVDHVLDAAGRLVGLQVDGRPALTQAFDRAGRPTEVREPDRGRSHRLTWSAGGRLLDLVTAVEDGGGDATSGGRWRWRYDGDGLVVAATAATGADERTTTWAYDGAGRLVEQVNGDVRVRLERDAAGRVLVLDAAGFHRELRYGAGGRVAQQTDRRADTAGIGAGDLVDVVHYEHDPAGRLVAVRHGGGASTYGYDAAGQLVFACDGADGGLGRAFGYDAAGRLAVERGPDGRLRRYRYDPVHRLVAITGPGSARFGYDPLGRRVHRTDAAGTTRYGWDVLGRLASIERDAGERRTLDVDAFGSLIAVDGTPLVWDPNGTGPELRAIGDRGVVAGGGTTLGLAGRSGHPSVSWLAGDWRGSAHPTGPWGDPLDPSAAGSGSGTGEPAPGFLGELEIDGLVWLRNRAYDPATRQFLSPDPLAGEPGSPVLSHPYHYAANDPIGRADPLGLAPMSIDAYKQYKKVTTGVQWKHIVFAAEVGLSVALMFTPLGPANAARMLAMAGPRIALSAGTKMAGMAINGSAQTAVWELAGQKLDEGLAWDEVRWGTVAKGTLFGGIGSMFGGAVGPRLGASVISPLLTKALRIPGRPANVASSLTTSSALLGTTSAGYEAYDLTNLPGSDGMFEPTNVIASTLSAVPYTVAGGFVAPVHPGP